MESNLDIWPASDQSSICRDISGELNPMDHRTSKVVKNTVESLPQDQEIPLLLELMSSTLDLDPDSL